MSETVATWADRWLTECERPAMSTFETYRHAVNRLVAECGSRPLDAIDRMEARRLAACLPRGPIKVARTMFNDAIDAGLIATNPFARLRLEASRGRRDLEALSESEVHELAEAALEVHEGRLGQIMRAWILTAGFTGIRPAESYALEPADLEGDELVVRGTKTATARRRVVLVPAAREALEPLCDDAGPRIFLSVRGRPFTTSTLHRYFDPIRKAAGRPELDPYDLRHAAATNWLLRGLEPWVIARLLGHADHGRLVTELYGHPQERDALDRVRAAYA